MSQLLLAITAVVLTLAGERLVNGPRDIRRGDERIFNCDEDLRAWIENEAKELNRSRIGLAIDQRPRKYEYLRAYEQLKLKEQTSKRYEDQLRSAERVVQEVHTSEQAHHAILRTLMRRPFPNLFAPTVEAERVRSFEVTDEHRFAAIREKAGKEFRELAVRQAADAAALATTQR